jgi:hypothetical protein
MMNFGQLKNDAHNCFKDFPTSVRVLIYTVVIQPSTNRSCIWQNQRTDLRERDRTCICRKTLENMLLMIGDVGASCNVSHNPIFGKELFKDSQQNEEYPL